MPRRLSLKRRYASQQTSDDKEGNANTANLDKIDFHLQTRFLVELPQHSFVQSVHALVHQLLRSAANPTNPSKMADTAPAQTAAPANGAAPTPSATAGAPNAPADQNAASRGLPYYEKLRRELRDTLQKKRLMDKSMVSHVIDFLAASDSILCASI